MAIKRLENMTEPELALYCNTAGKAIMEASQVCEVEKPKFVLLLFNDPKVAQYVCNCDREDVIKALREAADRLEHNEVLKRG